LNEARDPICPPTRSVKDEPALALPQAVMETVKVDAKPLKKILILKRSLVDDRKRIGHGSPPG